MSEETLTARSKPAATWKNLGIRFISAVTFAAICLAPFYFGGWLWAILVILLGLRVVWEWVRMSDLKATRLSYLIPVAGLIITVTYAYTQAWVLMMLAVIVTSGLAIIERARRGGGQWAGLGFIYIAIPSAFFMILRGNETGFSAAGFLLLIYLILVVVAADTGAYFGGSYFQGPKMAPKLSPKKTWSGFFSGCLAGIAVGALTAWMSGYSAFFGALFATPITVFSVMGDFLESALKRRLNVKDSGGVMPGHGGLLDRLGSLMFVVVVTGISLLIWPDLWPLPS